MAHPRNMGYRPSRGRIRPERILRGGSTATDLSPRRLSWHTGCVPTEPIHTLSGRTWRTRAICDIVRHAVGYGLNASCVEVLRQQIYRPAVYPAPPVAFPLCQSIHFPAP